MITELKGSYRIVNDAHMRKRAANSEDPRHIFYLAGLTSRTFEEYLTKVGDVKVEPPT
jgi:hypothetical protein